MVHLCDEISVGELFKALISTLDQFPLVDIFDWENWGWFVNDSSRAPGLRHAGGGHWPPSPFWPQGGKVQPWLPGLPVSKRHSLPVQPYQLCVWKWGVMRVPQRVSDRTFCAASLPSARAYVSCSCQSNLSVDLPGGECKSSPEERHRGLSACQLRVYACVWCQPSFL